MVAEPEEFQPFDLEALRNSGKQTEPVVQSTGGIRATNRLTSFDYKTRNSSAFCQSHERKDGFNNRGSSGIGFEVARQARERDAQLKVVARDPAKLAIAAERLGAAVKTAVLDAYDDKALENFS